jgi:hypothetical protein
MIGLVENILIDRPEVILVVLTPVTISSIPLLVIMADVVVLKVLATPSTVAEIPIVGGLMAGELFLHEYKTKITLTRKSNNFFILLRRSVEYVGKLGDFTLENNSMDAVGVDWQSSEMAMPSLAGTDCL